MALQHHSLLGAVKCRSYPIRLALRVRGCPGSVVAFVAWLLQIFEMRYARPPPALPWPRGGAYFTHAYALTSLYLDPDVFYTAPRSFEPPTASTVAFARRLPRAPSSEQGAHIPAGSSSFLARAISVHLAQGLLPFKFSQIHTFLGCIFRRRLSFFLEHCSDICADKNAQKLFVLLSIRVVG